MRWWRERKRQISPKKCTMRLLCLLAAKSFSNRILWHFDVCSMHCARERVYFVLSNHLFVDHGQRSINSHYANESVCMFLWMCHRFALVARFFTCKLRFDEWKQSIRKWKWIALWQLLCAVAYSTYSTCSANTHAKMEAKMEKRRNLSWFKKSSTKKQCDVCGVSVRSEKDRESI